MQDEKPTVQVTKSLNDKTSLDKTDHNVRIRAFKCVLNFGGWRETRTRMNNNTQFQGFYTPSFTCKDRTDFAIIPMKAVSYWGFQNGYELF